MKNKNGISLIILVVTIIVMIILTGAIVLNLNINTPISKATETTFKTNIDAYKNELKLALKDKYEDRLFDITEFDVGTWDGNNSNIAGTIKEYIPSINAIDAMKYEIQDGVLVYAGSDATEKQWSLEVDVQAKGLGVYKIAPIDSTVNGTAYSYSNPIIPKGFMAINDGAIWPVNWNSGLVIQDANGNQFVWVPVDGTNVKYEKWGTIEVPYNNPTIGDDPLPAGVTSEMAQITKYGGFYVGRYEAGKEGTNTLVYKKNAKIWNYVNYTESKMYSEAMYNTAEVKSGLITGTQWDTIMRWLENSGINTSTDSRNWGNYNDSVYPANVLHYGDMQVAGYSENWKSKNIYDLAGSMIEWTTEQVGVIESGMYVHRSAGWWESGDARPAATRCTGGYVNDSYDSIGFRSVLYIL